MEIRFRNYLMLIKPLEQVQSFSIQLWASYRLHRRVPRKPYFNFSVLFCSTVIATEQEVQLVCLGPRPIIVSTVGGVIIS
jgi:hypothetical protein